MAAERPCKAGCGRVVRQPKHWYCPACRRKRWKRRERLRERGRNRPSAESRGYGAEHRRLRAELAPIVDAGGAVCARCGAPIRPGEPWDLGHDDSDRSRYAGPEHRGCNRATAGRQTEVQSRRW